ncbi:hypothetical protein PACID_33720 [Acidipropionibacterium acidipropionici ATCC 4875]|uniref:Uncharacterized protein n=1 Tax=Acidipropionibacterium acidipropionici (strain ATCC 4875 / DSM 20272 / JCM 6432 / NBRC 12425 / NCIMB 8070 / 4) TaxID=1171373 RepID=K7S160_ACIA4|nr:hypothetical protein PACID_33720 [Acidipropionibacterium acidipropionici ATCC 4875]
MKPFCVDSRAPRRPGVDRGPTWLPGSVRAPGGARVIRGLRSRWDSPTSCPGVVGRPASARLTRHPGSSVVDIFSCRQEPPSPQPLPHHALPAGIAVDPRRTASPVVITRR